MYGAADMPLIVPTQNDAASYLHASSFGVGKRATIYFFTPRNLSDQCRRPHLYKFSVPFIDDLNRTIQQTNQSGMNVEIAANMMDCQSIHSAVTPSFDPIPINTNPFREMWTFILVVDGMGDPTAPPEYQNNMINNRTIYSGFCVDEPIKEGIYGGIPVNPMSQLIITHRTSVNAGTTIAMPGVRAHMHTVSNADVIPVQNIQMTAPNTQDVFSLTPDKLTKGIAHDPLDSKITVMGASAHAHASTISTYGNPIIKADLASPHQHLHHITSALMTVNSHGNPFERPEYREERLSVDASGMPVQSSAFTGLVSSVYPSVMGNDLLKPDRPIAMGQLMQVFPDLDIHDCHIPFNSTWSQETGNQAERTMQNVAHAVLSSTVPFYLGNHGLSDIHFRYNSFIRPNGLMGSQGAAELLGISGLIPMSDAELKIRFNTFMADMRAFVFPMIEQMNGHFDVTMFSSLSAPSVIFLHFLDYTQQTFGYYETNNILGGFNTPLFGDNKAFMNNTTELATLQSAIFDQRPEYLDNANMFSQWG